MSQGVIHNCTQYIGVMPVLAVVQMIGFGRGNRVYQPAVPTQRVKNDLDRAKCATTSLIVRCKSDRASGPPFSALSRSTNTICRSIWKNDPENGRTTCVYRRHTGVSFRPRMFRMLPVGFGTGANVRAGDPAISPVTRNDQVISPNTPPYVHFPNSRYALQLI